MSKSGTGIKIQEKTNTSYWWLYKTSRNM